MEQTREAITTNLAERLCRGGLLEIIATKHEPHNNLSCTRERQHLLSGGIHVQLAANKERMN